MPRFDISTLEDLRNASREINKPAKFPDEAIVLVLHPFSAPKNSRHKNLPRTNPIRCFVSKIDELPGFLIQVPCDSRGCAI